jgi:hypothetical protein
MEAFSYEAFQRNPELLAALLQQARRERAEAMHRLIVAPLTRLFLSHEAVPCTTTSA